MHLDTFSTLEEQRQASVYAHNALIGLEKIDDESLDKMKPFKSEYDSLYKKYSHILKLNL